MEITIRKIDDLIGAEYNPRQITNEEIEEIKDSIKRFGVVEPIIVNINEERKDIIVSGHQRVKVCKELKIKEVPCHQLDLTLEREKELNIRMNKAGGKFDTEMLLQHFEMENLLEYGFKDYELPNVDVEIDDLFEDVEDYKPKDETNKIVLEYNDEEYKLVIDKLAELDGTKEEIVFNLLKI